MPHRILIIISLIGPSATLYSMEPAEPQEPVQKKNELIAKYNMCAYCCRKEVGIEHFKLCGQCKKLYYCGTECQKSHWRLEHRSQCSEAFDGQAFYAALGENRTKIIDELDVTTAYCADIQIAALENQEAHELVTKGIKEKGLSEYQQFIIEQCIVARRKSDPSLTQLMHCYLIARAQASTASKEVVQDQERFQATYKSVYSNTRLFRESAPAFKDITKKNFDQAMKEAAELLEIKQEQGTRFLGKGYSQPVERALEELRKVLKALNSPKGEEGKYTHLTAIYGMLCKIPCLHLQKQQAFVEAVKTRNLLEIFQCLKYDSILEYLLDKEGFIQEAQAIGLTKIQIQNKLRLLKDHDPINLKVAQALDKSPLPFVTFADILCTASR